MLRQKTFFLNIPLIALVFIGWVLTLGLGEELTTGGKELEGQEGPTTKGCSVLVSDIVDEIGLSDTKCWEEMEDTCNDLFDSGTEKDEVVLKFLFRKSHGRGDNRIGLQIEETDDFVVEPGLFEIMVGSSSEDILLSGTLNKKK